MSKLLCGDTGWSRSWTGSSVLTLITGACPAPCCPEFSADETILENAGPSACAMSCARWAERSLTVTSMTAVSVGLLAVMWLFMCSTEYGSPSWSVSWRSTAWPVSSVV